MIAGARLSFPGDQRLFKPPLTTYRPENCHATKLLAVSCSLFFEDSPSFTETAHAVSAPADAVPPLQNVRCGLAPVG